VYTIPWGDEPGEISTQWNENPGVELLIFPPGPWAVSSAGELILVEDVLSEPHLMKFAPDGSFISRIVVGNVEQAVIPFPESLAISGNGEVLAGTGGSLFLLDSTLSLFITADLPHEDAHVSSIFPSNSGSFWVIYGTSSNKVDDIWYIYGGLIEFSQDGSMSEPQQISFSGTWEELHEMQSFVTPDGLLKQHVEDTNGFSYQFSIEPQCRHLVKRSPEGEIVYTNDLYSNPGWELWEELGGALYFITWSGDFYTLHATDEGAVLTKYELNLVPYCDFFVVTSMPYRGPSPAAIEFNASGSYDPNEGDELTYEWDFDGDFIFSEPVDDSYTGDPAYPTHAYTSDYEGPVNLRVSDPHAASSTCTALVIVDIM
jgi:hypothetical protein